MLNVFVPWKPTNRQSKHNEEMSFSFAYPLKFRTKYGIPLRVSSAFRKAFALNVFAEWGDRSQLTTAVLASKGHHLWGTLLGASLGQVLCVASAVFAGIVLARRISLKFGECTNSLDLL